MQKKKGISLIVLVITIIVMIILAAAIILSLNNAGIIGNANKAVAETNLAQMKDLASMSWGTAYADGARTLPQLKAKIEPELENAVGEELDNYEVTVGLKGITVVTKEEAPEDWDNVTVILDGVPIPKGFVASKALGENTRDEGLVIYEGTEEVNDENVEWAKKNINQYVWVPVYDFASLGNKTYKATSNGTEQEFSVTKQVATIVMNENNMPDLTQNNEYYSQETIQELHAVYTSIKKYGGFYVARYEAGTDVSISAINTLLDSSKVRFMQNKYPYISLRCGSSTDIKSSNGGVIQVVRNIYNDNSRSVSSTLMYLPLWYRIGEWIDETNLGINFLEGDVTHSYKYGNSLLTSINKEQFVEGAKYFKVSEISNMNQLPSLYKEITTNKTPASSNSDYQNIWMLTTGSTDVAKQNNIYDLVGNLTEWDMFIDKEGETYYRHSNGNYHGGGRAFATGYNWNLTDCGIMIGFRAILYIK